MLNRNWENVPRIVLEKCRVSGSPKTMEYVSDFNNLGIYVRLSAVHSKSMLRQALNWILQDHGQGGFSVRI